MANNLDDLVTPGDDSSERPRRVYIFGTDQPEGVASVAQGTPNLDPATTDNRLVQAVAPQPGDDQPGPASSLLENIAKLRDYIYGMGSELGSAGVEPGPEKDELNRQRNRIFGTGGEERYQFWPERMVRSGATLAGDVMSGQQPMNVVDPVSGKVVPNPEMIARTLDMAGLAGGGALTERPGVATLGSGPVRPEMRPPSLTPAVKFEGKIYPGHAPGSRSSHPEIFPDAIYERMQEQGLEFPDEVPGVESGFIDERGRYLTREKAGHYAEDMGLVRPEYKGIARKGGLGSEMLLSDTSQPGAAVAGALKSASPFYSALEHATTNAAQDTMAPQQWLGYLKNQPGVKPEELQWSGIGDWLGAQKGKVSKQDVQKYLDEHKVEVKDVTKGGSDEGAVADTLPNERLKDAFNNYDEELGHPAHMDREYLQSLVEEGDLKKSDLKAFDEWVKNNPPRDSTKYSDYQLPGGENYREHLLTLPRKEITTNDVAQKLFKRNMANLDENERQAVSDEMRRTFEQSKSDYRSSHWDEPNVLAHVRTNERDVEGKPSLHIEEIQSDWHQQGRKQGYREKRNEAPKVEQELNDMGYKVTSGRVLRNKAGDMVTQPNTPEDAAALRTFGRWLDESNKDYIAGQGVPQAPFKTAWPELALKRMIRMAAEEGKDRISWTPGEAQAARYDLSKQLDKIQYHADKQRLVGIKDNGVVMDKEGVPPEKVEDYIGKDVAKKLLESDPAHIGKIHELRGLDLKVGGEGMKGFYDNMLPKMAEKLGKAYGVKVKKGDVGDGFQVLDSKGEAVTGFKYKQDAENWIKKDGRPGYTVKAKPQPVWYFDIPPAMKNAALHKGFPLFASGVPFPLVPVDHNPFEKKERK